MNIRTIIVLFLLLIFPQKSIAQNGGFGRFVNKVFHTLFSSQPEAQLHKLVDAIKYEKGNKKYLETLNKIEKKLLKYKRNHRYKFETTVNLTLALVKYEKYLVLEKSTSQDCIESFRYWGVALNKYQNISISGKIGSKDLKVLLKHGHKVGFKIDKNNLLEGEEWIKQQIKLVENCPIPYNCREIDNYSAFLSYSRKLKRILKRITKLSMKFEKSKNKKALTEEKQLRFELDAHGLLEQFSEVSKNVPIATNYARGTLYDIIKDKNLLRNLDIKSIKNKKLSKRASKILKESKIDRTNCFYSHDAWSQLIEFYTKESYEFKTLNRWLSKSLNTKLDSVWFSEKYEQSKNCYSLRTIYACNDKKAINYDSISSQKYLSNVSVVDRLGCHCIYEGCTTDTTATNYVSPIKRVLEVPCEYKGCMDSCYLEFNPKANIEGECITNRCTCLDSCYIRQDNIPDSIAIHNPAACDTLINICGCTNPCSPEYNSNAIDDDGSCTDECGCKDKRADNYSPRFAYHIQDSCRYSKLPVVDNLNNIIQDFNVEINSVQDRRLRKNLRRGVKFRNIQKGGGVGFDISLNVTAKQEDMRLGQYQSQEVNEVIDKVLDFLNRRAGKRFDLAEMEVFLIGEADGTRIKSSGIRYHGDPIHEIHFYNISEYERYKIPDNIQNVSLVNSSKVSLSPGAYFNDYDNSNDIYGNTILAFLRGYAASIQIKRTKTDLDLVNKVKYGAIRNTKIGGTFRRVTIIADLYNYNYSPDFYNSGGNGESIITECLCPN